MSDLFERTYGPQHSPRLMGTQDRGPGYGRGSNSIRLSDLQGAIVRCWLAGRFEAVGRGSVLTQLARRRFCFPRKYPRAGYFIPLAKTCNPM